MKQWTDLPVQTGLLSLDYRLYDEPVLGDWRIEAEVNGRTTQQNFTITKYVLPRFQIQATLPDSLTVATKVITVKVCARFTFGKPVEGFLNASVCLHNVEPNWFCIDQQRPCVSIQSKIDGCHKFDIDTSLLNITLRKYSLLCKPQIRLVANVTERNSGIVVRETFDGVGVWEERVRMHIHANKHFKPFFPYIGKVYVWKPDGLPAVSEDISLNIDQLGIRVTLTTDSTGHAHFTLHNLTTATSYFVINAQTLDSENTDQKLYTIYPAKTKRHVKQWYSPTSTYIDLYVTPRERRNCGDNVNINMAFSEGPDAQIVAAYYQLISKGNTLKIEDITDNIRFSRKYTMKTQGTILTPKKPVEDEDSSEEEDSDLEENVAVAGPPHLGAAFGPPGTEGGSMGPPGTSGVDTQAEAQGRAQVAPIESLGLDESKGVGTKIDDSSIKRLMQPPSQREFTIKVVLSEVMTPRVRVLVYMVTDTGEVAADSIYLDILHCHRNKVKMSFDKGNARPGEPVEMTITATPHSLCTASMVDKGVYLVGGVNLLLPSHLDDTLERYDLTSDFVNDWQYCSDTSVLPPDFSNAEGPPFSPGTHPLDDWLDSDYSPLLRKRRSIMQYNSNMYDSLLAFKTAGVMVLTDLDLLTRPCLHSGDNLGPPYLPSDPKGPIPGPGGFLDPLEPTEDPTDVRPPVTILRKNFPETWLWDLYEVTSSGSVSFTQTMPDTVTQWVGNSLCLHESAGLGISDVAKVTGFQPFFVDVSLPYSVVRGENAEIKITVFNYLPHCIALQVDIRKQAWFSLLAHEDWQFCVCAGQSVANSYHIVPSEIGVHMLTISAFIREHRVSCRSTVAPPGYHRKHVTELVARKLIVEAEGLEEERTQSQFICPQDSPDGVLALSLTPQIPSRDFIVNGSLRGWINIVGDIMGPALEGLADLIQLPTGCGEQNLVRLAPNIAILQYLTATSQLTDDVELRALNHLNKGYQQQLKFMHKDGSYSAFGAADNTGSTWLSAFVFKTLSQAENFIFIDRKQIQAKTWEFLLYQQGEDGCFYESGKVLGKYMMGGVGANKKGHRQALTAYVLVAMLESFQMMRERTPPFVALAIRCIDVDDLNDTYTQALVAYAMALYKPQSQFSDIVINQLLEKAVKQDAMMFWRREYQPDILSGQGRAASAEVEMTSYILLAILTKDEQAPISNVIPIVRWLASQTNSYGGFASTQDTVVALQALSLFSRRIYGSGLDVKVNVLDSFGLVRDFHVSSSNRIVLQRQDLAHPDSVLKVSAKGEGCVMLQLTSRYNIENKVIKDNRFNLTVRTPVTMEILNKKCRRRPVSICASYLGNSGHSNMVVIEMKVPSGWQPDLDQLQNLLNSVELGMKKYEVDSPARNTINFYFDQLDTLARCFSVTLWQEVRVDNNKLAVVKVYDYYETGEQTMTFYEMSACSLEAVETIDVSIEPKSVAQTPDAILQTDILEQPRSGGSSENAASTGEVVEPEGAATIGEVVEPEGASAPKFPFKQTCPKCFITGTVDLMAKLCSRQVWIIEKAGNQGNESLTLQVMAADGVSPELSISMPTGLLSCPMCEPFFAGNGLKSIVFLEPFDWHALGANILHGSNQVIVWSESLQEALLGALTSCPRP
ncbi:murinoglobulin-2-like isoform X2 [Dreissena polymorpha]|nr:murinoglobulin-2-like isoform X2 [Dreissena polymorpha]